MPEKQTIQMTRNPRSILGVLMLIAGAQAIVAQSLLLREACVLMSGSELAWGIILFAWLTGVSIGAPLGGFVSRRITRAELLFMGLLIGMNVMVGASIWMFRGARGWLSVGPGEILSPQDIVVVALALVTPCSLVVGAMFPVATAARTAIGNRRAGVTGLLGKMYAWESAGSLIAGAMFSFWAVEHLQPLQLTTACLCVAAVGSTVACWLIPGRKYEPLALTVIAMIVAGVFVLTSDAMDRALVQRRWQRIAAGYELVNETNSRYQNLAVGRRDQQYTLFCDGQVASSFPDPWTYGPMTHLAMCQHPFPRRVLLIGGGVEGVLAEILKYPVEHVDYVEPDPKVLAIIAPYLAPAERDSLADTRVALHTIDARHFIKSARNRYDLVIARLPEPISSLRARFYTADFYCELREAMSENGVLFMTVAAAPTTLGSAASSYLSSIRAMLREHFPEVVVSWGDPAIVLASNANGLITTNPAELERRFVSHSVRSDYFDPAWFLGATDNLDPEKMRLRDADLNRVEHPRVSTDLHAAIYLQRLVMWEQATAGTQRGSIQWLVSLPLSGISGITAGILLLFVLIARAGRVPAVALRRAVVFSIGTTGFATMALSIVWLFAFQSLYGYVYQRIGWIVALFMGGVVMGASWGRHHGLRHESRPANLILIDASLATLALAASLVLYGLQGITNALLVETVISILVAATGIIGGAAFAVAGELLAVATPDQTTSAVTWIVWADHLGAAAGALLTGVFLVPVYGIPLTAIGITIIKIVAVVLLVLVRTDRPSNFASD